MVIRIESRLTITGDYKTPRNKETSSPSTNFSYVRTVVPLRPPASGKRKKTANDANPPVEIQPDHFRKCGLTLVAQDSFNRKPRIASLSHSLCTSVVLLCRLSLRIRHTQSCVSNDGGFFSFFFLPLLSQFLSSFASCSSILSTTPVYQGQLGAHSG